MPSLKPGSIATKLQSGAISLAKNGDADQYIVTHKQYDPDTGEEIEAVVSDTSLAETDALIARLQAQIDDLTALREALTNAPMHEAEADVGDMVAANP